MDLLEKISGLYPLEMALQKSKYDKMSIELILNAVQSHEELLNALKTAVLWIDPKWDTTELKAIIAKAEEK